MSTVETAATVAPETAALLAAMQADAKPLSSGGSGAAEIPAQYLSAAETAMRLAAENGWTERSFSVETIGVPLAVALESHAADPAYAVASQLRHRLCPAAEGGADGSAGIVWISGYTEWEHPKQKGAARGACLGARVAIRKSVPASAKAVKEGRYRTDGTPVVAPTA